jgi:hypothetical protein
MPWGMKEGNKTSHHDPYKLGYTCATMGKTIRSQRQNLKPIFKFSLSSDYFLQLESMKEELPVIAYQQRCGEIVLIRRLSSEEAINVCRVTYWNEVVTR